MASRLSLFSSRIFFCLFSSLESIVIFNCRSSANSILSLTLSNLSSRFVDLEFNCWIDLSLANERSIQQLNSKSTNLEDKLDSVNDKIELAEDLQLKITMLSNELNKQKKILDENNDNLDAIDKYRIQNNQKVTEILTRLNNLSRELEDIQESLSDQEGSAVSG